MNTEDYIIVNKRELEKELESLKAIKNNGYILGSLNYDKHYIDAKIYSIESLFSNSKPLQPLLEEAFNAGFDYAEAKDEHFKDFEKFIKDKEI